VLILFFRLSVRKAGLFSALRGVDFSVSRDGCPRNLSSGDDWCNIETPERFMNLSQAYISE
jgi:hypothetical protein